jgi:molybdopterin-dependent oxidoreductase alpha subunit
MSMSLPFGLGERKPNHYLEMLRIAWQNREHPLYAWKLLSRGVCDGCALGTSGLKDWTISGTHLCLVRLNLLRLNTMDPMDPSVLGDVASLDAHDGKALRDLGRLGEPMVRRPGEAGFTRTSWTEAIERLGARLAATPPDRAALFLTSRGLTNEVYYAMQKAWRCLGSPHLDNAARLCHSPSTVAMRRTLGVAASTCSYRDWMDAELVIFFGSNPANDQPVSLKYLLEARRKGVRVFAVNTFDEPGLRKYWVPSDASSAVFGTEIVERFFRVHTGGDLAFLCAVQRLLVERGLVDRAFVDAHVDGFEAWAAALLAMDPVALAREAGVDPGEIDAFAELVGRHRRVVFVWSMGLTQHGHGAETVGALCNLGLLRGFVGHDGAGLMPIRGHSGVQGGAEMGAYCSALPGGRPLADPAARADFEALWGFPVPEGPGMHTVAMIEAAAAGALDVLYSVGGNFLETLPQPALVEKALARVPVRIHQDIVLTRQMLVPPREEVWILPARTRYEQEGGGTETTTERRILFSPHIPGHDVASARSEWRIVLDLVRAARPDRAHLLDFPDASAIRAEIERAVPAYAGIAALQRAGDQVQYGGRHLCTEGRFPLPGGRARLWVVDPPDRSTPGDVLRLATRRGKQFNSMVHAEHDPLTGARRDAILMAASDAATRGLSTGDWVRVTSTYGEALACVHVAPIHPGNVQMHWPEANALLPHDRIDPFGFVPDYNAGVRVRRHDGPPPEGH